jgi:hypothetical protein
MVNLGGSVDKNRSSRYRICLSQMWKECKIATERKKGKNDYYFMEKEEEKAK